MTLILGSLKSADGYLHFMCCYIVAGLINKKGWSDGAIVLGKLPVPERPTFWMLVGQGPIPLAVDCGWGLLGDFYSPLSFLSSFSLSLRDGPI